MKKNLRVEGVNLINGDTKNQRLMTPKQGESDSKKVHHNLITTKKMMNGHPQNNFFFNRHQNNRVVRKISSICNMSVWSVCK
jgi:hypothetical protein